MLKRKIKIAIADDHDLFRKGMMAMLSDFLEFNVVVEAANGEDLLEKLKKTKVDLVLLDLEMPIMDGIETTERLKAKYPETKIIIVTMHNEEGFIHHLISKGANGFILKDQDIEVVVDAIYGVIENDYYFNDRISRAMVKGLVINNKIKPSFNKVSLTDREKLVIQLICKEYTNKEIAEKLTLSVRTVDGYRERILQKTKAKNIIGVVMYAIKNNIID